MDARILPALNGDCLDGGHRLPDHGPGPCIIHNTSFDFNDETVPIGASYLVRLAQRWMAQP